MKKKKFQLKLKEDVDNSVPIPNFPQKITEESLKIEDEKNEEAKNLIKEDLPNSEAKDPEEERKITE